MPYFTDFIQKISKKQAKKTPQQRDVFFGAEDRARTDTTLRVKGF